MLSIDWDFFIWNASEALNPMVEIQGKQKYLSLLFDWGHSESHSPSVQDMLWVARAGRFKHHGLNIEEEFTIRKDRGCVQPDTFTKELRARFDLSGARNIAFDSHLNAFLWLEALYDRSRCGVHLIHFDAHCDLGYGEEPCEEENKCSVDAGSWLYQALEQDLCSVVDIVYPDWKGLWEWKEFKASPHIRRLLKHEHFKVNVFTWESWLAAADSYPRRENVDLITTARSSAWTPPWLDAEFNTFVHSLNGSQKVVCGDCHARRVLGKGLGGFDICIPRQWDNSVVEQ